jgi:hypothetical protein
MAINYYSSIDLLQNQLINPRIQNEESDAAIGNGVNGQIYFNTDSNTLKVWITSAWYAVPSAGTGFVNTVTTLPSTFVNLVDNGTATDPILTASLSAAGTPDDTKYLRGDNTWAALPGPETITLTGEVTGSGTTAISTTVANDVLDIANFTAATIVTAEEGIELNDNDTTLPTSAAVKYYVDQAIVGGLVYQGSYDASINSPDLDTTSNISVKQGWTYTVTQPGLFFTEQVRTGDVIIANQNIPANDATNNLSYWTTVQNNIDLADLITVGIGNVNAGTGISVAYSNGTATVTNTQTNAANTYETTISATDTITHNLGTRDVMIQLYDTDTFETIYADVTRTSTATATITFNPTPTNSVKVLVQKIG